MTEMRAVKMKDLVGQHMLTGVDRLYSETIKGHWGDYVGEVLRVQLDGVTYVFREDDNDGYRSACCDDIVMSDEPPVNVFPALPVLIEVLDVYGRWGEAAEVLRVRDRLTGNTIIDVGTGNTDDYYPYFVAEFDPLAMSVNQ